MENTLNRTISEDYVSFETARLLKKKGFSEECNTYFISDNEIALIPIQRDFNNNGIYLSAPTLQMAMKWLRKHNLFVWIGKDSMGYWFRIQDDTTLTGLSNVICGHTSYEEAACKAIKLCLTDYL